MEIESRLIDNKKVIQFLINQHESLTLEQLWEMDGQPVYVKNMYFSELSGWGIMLDNVCNSYHGVYFIEEYGRSWLAYAYPPVHINREAWNSCEFCGELDASFVLYAGYSKQVAVDEFYEDEIDDVKFCPKCGRPLTNEAWDILEKRIKQGQMEGI